MNSLKEKMLETELTDQQLGIFYLGQVGFLLKYRKCYFLIDGYLSDYVDRNCSQLVKWVRRYPAPLKGEDLDFVDYVSMVIMTMQTRIRFLLLEGSIRKPGSLFRILLSLL